MQRSPDLLPHSPSAILLPRGLRLCLSPPNHSYLTDQSIPPSPAQIIMNQHKPNTMRLSTSKLPIFKQVLTSSLLALTLWINTGTNQAQDLTPIATPETGAASALIQIDTTGPGWVELGKDDFQRANCDEETWTWDGPLVHCTGKPVGVLRSKKKYRNLEFVGWWRHLSHGGNSGFFLWTPDEALEGLVPNRLPNAGIEVQVLDHGYTEQYEKSSGKKATWFTTHGDIFPVGKSKLKPFPPLSPDGSRSFPKGEFSKPSPNWNFYYVRAINGEVRLWVNGHEVSGGNQADPPEGYLCLESEGAPVEFKHIRIRELP